MQKVGNYPWAGNQLHINLGKTIAWAIIGQSSAGCDPGSEEGFVMSATEENMNERLNDIAGEDETGNSEMACKSPNESEEAKPVSKRALKRMKKAEEKMKHRSEWR